MGKQGISPVFVQANNQNDENVYVNHACQSENTKYIFISTIVYKRHFNDFDLTQRRRRE